MVGSDQERAEPAECGQVRGSGGANGEAPLSHADLRDPMSIEKRYFTSDLSIRS